MTGLTYRSNTFDPLTNEGTRMRSSRPVAGTDPACRWTGSFLVCSDDPLVKAMTERCREHDLEVQDSRSSWPLRAASCEPVVGYLVCGLT